MTFQQIAVTNSGEKGYTILLYALSVDGNLYVLKTGTLNPEKGEWRQVKSDRLDT